MNRGGYSWIKTFLSTGKKQFYFTAQLIFWEKKMERGQEVFAFASKFVFKFVLFSVILIYFHC